MNRQYRLIAPCHFGTEAVLKEEIKALGYEIAEVNDGKVTFLGDAAAIARCNVFLRTTERILLEVASFRATTFDQLFEGTKALNWKEFLPADARFWVAKATSIKSKLFSPSDIQRIMKKAIVESLKLSYGRSVFPETGADYPIRVTLMKDVVTIGLDTSGDSLHKRGYRKLCGKAPITETLAAALLMMTPWKNDRHLVDPFCGSGTFPIEAAMLGANIAPGMDREFTAENWKNLIEKKAWYEAVEEASDLADRNELAQMSIQGYDIDGKILAAARENARCAGVDQYIHFQERDVAKLNHPNQYGFVITNPPYGARLEDKEAMPALYRQIAESFKRLPTWSFYVISGYEDTEKYLGTATKRRKIYNGMMKTCFYQYLGPKPPKRNKESQAIQEKRQQDFACSEKMPCD